MPKQNRVNPFGEIIAVAAKGGFMGNRGCLHSDQGVIRKQWARKAWVTCLLEYNNRHRQVMAPGQYTELFFLDEVTALSAGHRPCGTCQKYRYKEFKELWTRSNFEHFSKPVKSIGQIDECLHRERFASKDTRSLDQLPLNSLPNGCFIVRGNKTNVAWLYWGQKLYPWGEAGYGAAEEGDTEEIVGVITPSSIVRLLLEGYCPQATVP